MVETPEKFHHAKFEEKWIFLLISMETGVTFVVWLLINWLVNLAETFTNVLKHYFLEMNAAKFVKCML